MGQYFNQPLVFLVDIIFGIYVTIVLLRFLFQILHVDFYNPISQLIVKATNPPLRLLRRIIPSIGKIDTASVVLMLAVQYIAFVLITLIVGAPFYSLELLALSAVEILNHTFNVFIFSIFILAIFSWISSPNQYNPVIHILGQLIEPLMKPARRILPPMSGIDLSPMLVMIALFFFKLLLIPPLQDLANMINI